MFCAHELRKHELPLVVIEKENRVGGLAATHELHGAKFEVGPHIFHTEDEYVMSIVKEYLGDQLLLKEWSVSQYIQGQLFLFPNSILDMWNKVGTLKMIEFFLSFLGSRFMQTSDYASFLYKKVGRKLAELNIINYTEKMWGVPLESLETEWIKPRLDRISIAKIITSSIHGHKRSFHYPVEGAGMLYNQMAHQLKVKLSEYPIEIEHEGNQISKITTNNSSYLVDNLFSSIPLLELLKIFRPKPPSEILKAANSLKYRSQVYVVVLVDEPNLLNEQWIYFPEKDIPFCRVHSSGAFSANQVPQGQSLLVFEYFCFEEDSIWHMSNSSIFSQTIDIFSNLPFVANFNVIEYKIQRKKYAYPLMSKEKNIHLRKIENYLSEFDNLETMGRHGLHTYDNQDDAGRTGIDSANMSIEA